MSVFIIVSSRLLKDNVPANVLDLSNFSLTKEGDSTFFTPIRNSGCYDPFGNCKPPCLYKLPDQKSCIRLKETAPFVPENSEHENSWYIL